MLIPTEIRERMLQRLRFVYSPDSAPEIFAGIEALIAKYSGTIPSQPKGWTQKDALLITYADSLLGPQPPLQTLHEFLRQDVGDLLNFVHLLPFFPFTSDDGFAVQDFRAVRDDLGTWEDVTGLARDYRLVFDGVINHVSAASRYMEGYCAGDPAYADFFIALDPKTDTSSVLRTRNLPLLHDFQTTEGTKWLWTTFSRDQADLNFANPKVLIEILDVMLFYARMGCSMVRLDAIPYLWKQLGTSCAHLPQTHELIKLLRDVYDAAAPHVLLLTETNVPHRENVSYFGHQGDEAQMIYNFSLAPLILWSLMRGDASTLTDWAKGIEKISDRATYLNITATHDGIGMRPTEGILTEAERSAMVQRAFAHKGDMTGKRNSDGSVSPYELNLNYFDAVNDPNSKEPLERQLRRFLVSQAIPMSMIGLPGIYIHSLLGSRNDYAGVKQTGRARSINREQLHLSRLRQELANPESLRAQVFGAMKEMLRIRSARSAFHPDALQEILDLGPALFALRRCNVKTGETVIALHNISDRGISIAAEKIGVKNVCADLLNSEQVSAPAIALAPYQTRWLLVENALHERRQ